METNGKTTAEILVESLTDPKKSLEQLTQILRHQCPNLQETRYSDAVKATRKVSPMLNRLQNQLRRLDQDQKSNSGSQTDQDVINELIEDSKVSTNLIATKQSEIIRMLDKNILDLKAFQSRPKDTAHKMREAFSFFGTNTHDMKKNQIAAKLIELCSQLKLGLEARISTTPLDKYKCSKTFIDNLLIIQGQHQKSVKNKDKVFQHKFLKAYLNVVNTRDFVVHLMEKILSPLIPLSDVNQPIDSKTFSSDQKLK